MNINDTILSIFSKPGLTSQKIISTQMQPFTGYTNAIRVARKSSTDSLRFELMCMLFPFRNGIYLSHPLPRLYLLPDSAELIPRLENIAVQFAQRTFSWRDWARAMDLVDISITLWRDWRFCYDLLPTSHESGSFISKRLAEWITAGHKDWTLKSNGLYVISTGKSKWAINLGPRGELIAGGHPIITNCTRIDQGSRSIASLCRHCALALRDINGVVIVP